jgi:transcriptional regulator with XRE-family HTH domain
MLEPSDQRRGRHELAEALKELRRASGLSGERLALRCAMSQSKISRIEAGKTIPSVVDVERILSALDVGPAVVVELLAAAPSTPGELLLLPSMVDRHEMSSEPSWPD